MSNASDAFLKELATNPELLGRFIHDPDAVLNELGVSDADRQAIKAGVAQSVHQKLTTGTDPQPYPVVW